MSKSNANPARTLALAMIVRDEEKNIRRCLDSVIGLVDEMVIVDTGSTDATKSIVASYADKVPGGLEVLDFEWCDDFSAARNFGLDAVTSDWIFAIDADEEYLSGGEELREILKDKYHWGYQVTYHSILDGEDIGSSKSTFSGTRIFRNMDELRYQSRIHEHVVVPSERLGFSDLTLNHFGFFADKGRSERNLQLLKRAIEDRPLFGFLWAKLGAEYLYNDNSKDAYPVLVKALELSEDKSLSWVMAASRDLALCLYEMGRPREAMQAIIGYQRQYPFYTDLYFIEGEIARGVGDTERAMAAYKTCLEKGDPPKELSSLGGTGSTRPRMRMEQLMGKSGSM